MSEIEKLYENAGVQSFKTCEFCTQKNIDCLKENTSNITCGLSKDAYPPFTTWKQLDLFKLLIRHPKTEIYCRYSNDKYKLIMYTEDCCTSDIGSFENVLASVVCDVWGLLSEEEKQQIKEILE